MRNSEEEWARRILQDVLNKSVEHHDDNSQDSMYDLRIGSKENPEIAIEVVSSIDPEFAAMWNAGPRRGSWRLNVHGNWWVVISNSAPIRPLRKNLERILQLLENHQIHDLHVDHRLKWGNADFFSELDALQISQIRCYEAQGEGKVYLQPAGWGGAVDEYGNSISDWVSDFLRHSSKQDVLYKLSQSSAKQNHVFIPVSLSGANWSVESYLTGDMEFLPQQKPDLPSPVDCVWLAHTFSSKGICWNGEEWHSFVTRNSS